MFKISALATLPALAQGGALFATYKPSTETQQISQERLKSLLPQEYGGDHVADVATSNLAALQPLFNSLPKDESGGLGPSTVRYAMKRYFSQTIKGFDPTSPAFNAMAAVFVEEIPMDQAAAYMQHAIQTSKGSGSFGLTELSALAASIERLLESEQSERFNSALNLQSVEGDELDESNAETVLYNYMMSYVLGFDPASQTPEELEAHKETIWEIFPNWGQVWSSTKAALTEALAGRKALTRAEVEDVAMTASEKVSKTHQETGCPAMQKTLLKFEEGGSGRVALTNFYKAASEGYNWHFQENRDYLRALAVLDETDKKTVRVVVQNYMLSQPNCIASSGLSSVCCVSECDGLLGKIEEEIGAPETEATRLIQIFEGALSSSTVDTPRILSPMLKQRLQKVADRHGGKVPLHGRLFAQWMHHAFPRECPYPRVTGAAQTAEVAASRTASDMSAAEHFAPRSAVGAPNTITMEELDPAFQKATREAHARPQRSLRMEACRMVFLLLALIATVVGLFRTAYAALVGAGMIADMPKVRYE